MQKVPGSEVEHTHTPSTPRSLTLWINQAQIEQIFNWAKEKENKEREETGKTGNMLVIQLGNPNWNFTNNCHRMATGKHVFSLR